jgi:hypothetical protein
MAMIRRLTIYSFIASVAYGMAMNVPKDWWLDNYLI